MIPDDFNALSRDFNASAGKFTPGTPTLRLLMAKYGALYDHKAKSDADRMDVARSLLDCAISVLNGAARPPQSGTSFTPGERNYPESALESVNTMLKRLTRDGAAALPQNAHELVADAALAVISKAENLTYGQMGGGDRAAYMGALATLAETALSHADHLRAANTAPDISTSRVIPASKPLTLRREGDNTP